MAETVWVTGASGFTGSRLARRLAQDGLDVRAVVRPSSKLEALEGVLYQKVLLDLSRDPIHPEMLAGVDTVYHVAAVYRTQGVPDAYFYAVHVEATQRLLRAARDAGVRRVVHVSTVGVHGNIENPPADEEAPFYPADVYQRSKLEGEKLAQEYFTRGDLPGVIIRPTAIYGPGDTRFLKLFRGIHKGIFWMIGKGEAYYHLNYIDDLVEGILLAAHSEQAVGQTFILGGDQPVLIRELVDLIAEILDRRPPRRRIPLAPVMLAARLSEAVFRPLGVNPPLYPRRLDFFIKDRWFDISKARRILGYQPRVNLRTGLACTAEWYRQQGYLS